MPALIDGVTILYYNKKKECKMKSCLLILCIFLFCIGCTKNTKIINNESKINIPIEENNNSTNVEPSYPYEYGNICITNITENDVNIRNYPSLDGKIIHKAQKDDIIWIIGFSGEKESIDGFDGNWLNITFENNNDIKGWVFSKYVNANDREFTQLKFVELIPIINNKIPKIKLSYTLYYGEIYVELSYSEIKKDKYYAFQWGYSGDKFHYTTRPGIYIFDKEALELKHITYIGSDRVDLDSWIDFTDDFKYLILGGFKSGFTAWRLSDQKEIISGNTNYEIYGHTIEMVSGCSDWDFEQGYIDEEILKYGKKYQEEHKIPQYIEDQRKNTGLYVELTIICSYNLDTGERKILDGKYILKQ
jgi:hypothetical protein